MHSVRIELAKWILVGTRITYQATGDAFLTLNRHFYLSTSSTPSVRADSVQIYTSSVETTTQAASYVVPVIDKQDWPIHSLVNTRRRTTVGGSKRELEYGADAGRWGV